MIKQNGKKFRTWHMMWVAKDLKVRSLCGRLRNEHTKHEIGLVGRWDLVSCWKCVDRNPRYRQDKLDAWTDKMNPWITKDDGTILCGTCAEDTKYERAHSGCKSNYGPYNTAPHCDCEFCPCLCENCVGGPERDDRQICEACHEDTAWDREHTGCRANPATCTNEEYRAGIDCPDYVEHCSCEVCFCGCESCTAISVARHG